MTREKAQDEILVRLDEIQQILRRYDPEHGDEYFSVKIVGGRIGFNNDYWTGEQRPLNYDESLDPEFLHKAEEFARARHILQ